MSRDLFGAAALITGSTKGIGRGIARELVEHGARVIVHGRDHDEALTYARQLGDGAAAVAGDLSTAEGCAFVCEQVDRLGWEVDVLVNNAGYWERSAADEITPEQWQRILFTNVIGGALLTQHFGEQMMRRGNGVVIFVSSENGTTRPDPDMVHYGVSKAAQLHLAQSWSRVAQGTGVRVVTVLPGPTMTPGNQATVNQYVSDGTARSPYDAQQMLAGGRPPSMLERWTEVEEVARVVAFLASSDASAITGTAIDVSGGRASW